MPQVISFHYTLTSTEGEVLDSSTGKPAFSFLTGSRQIIPGLEKEMILLKKGDKKKISVVAAEAYGQQNPELVVKVSPKDLPAQNIQVGDRFKGGAEEHAPIFRVIEITDQEITLDANHPMAGKDLHFDVEITDVRDASEEELQHGHAHDPHSGHHH
jgi:FKBP-type peptidyl-prolyl cis-trans isomerase SlyD